MIRLDQISPFLPGRRVLILGLGISGLSMARWAAQAGAHLRLADTRDGVPASSLATLTEQVKQSPLEFSSKIELAQGPNWSEQWLSDIDQIAWSPGLSLEKGPPADFFNRANQRGIKVSGELEWFAKAQSNLSKTMAAPRIFGITGTNGKTTSTRLVTKIAEAGNLRAKEAGNIHPALLDALLDALLSQCLPDVWVLELSSFQLALWHGNVPGFTFDATSLLNFTADHLDWHASMESYYAAKQRIHLQTQLVVFDREEIATFSSSTPPPFASSPPTLAKHAMTRNQASFGLSPPLCQNDWGLQMINGTQWVTRADQPLLPWSEVQLHGNHNQRNVLAALALCSPLNLQPAALKNALREYAGEPHRCSLVDVIEGVYFYDDSKGTNVGAACAALRGIEKPCRLIAGGEGKGQDFSPLAQAVQEHAKGVYLIGKDAPLLRKTLQHTDVPLFDCHSLAHAVERAKKDACPGEAILLSPACASFDMFRNYEHRAEVFTAAVRALHPSSRQQTP